MSEIVDRVRSRMRDRGFPETLLPDCIAADDFDEGTGVFTVTLQRKVDLEVEGIKVHYAKQIKGTIRKGRIEGLSGVQVKKGLWFPISRIDADDAELTFHVSKFTQKIPRSAWSC